MMHIIKVWEVKSSRCPAMKPLLLTEGEGLYDDGGVTRTCKRYLHTEDLGNVSGDCSSEVNTHGETAFASQ